MVLNKIGISIINFHLVQKLLPTLGEAFEPQKLEIRDQNWEKVLNQIGISIINFHLVQKLLPKWTPEFLLQILI